MRNTASSFKCNGGNTNNLKVFSNSQSKNNKFEESKKCLNREEYQKDCDKYLFRYLYQEMYLQLVQKGTLSPIDDKR